MTTQICIKPETLGYVCKATKQRHNAVGFVYRNRWATGAQDLVFASHQDAEKWANRREGVCLFKGPTN